MNTVGRTSTVGSGESRRRIAALAAALTLSAGSMFGGAGVSAADPYGDDDGGSYSGEESTGGMQEPAPAADEPAGGGEPGEEQPGFDGDQPHGEGEHLPGGMPEPDEQQPGFAGDQPPDEQQPGEQQPGFAGDQPPGEEQPGFAGDQPSGGEQQQPAAGGFGGDEPPAPGGLAEPAETQATQEDLTAANASEVTTAESTTISSEEVSSYRESIESTFTSSTSTTSSVLSSPVSVWNSQWIRYDRYYRPVLTNPYRIPLQVVYDYGGQSRTFSVPPLQRAVVDVPNSGVYNFTTMSRPSSGPVSNVSVGSFSGGGFQPGPGQAPPPKPATLTSVKKPLVQVKFSNGTSEPFRVSSLTEIGKDPAVDNLTKVLLDGEIPAWGQWSKNNEGEALFEITETQQLPGIKPPAQEPLPGYTVKLTAGSQSTGASDQKQDKPTQGKNNPVLIGAGVGAGVLALIAVGLAVMRKRRQPTE